MRTPMILRIGSVIALAIKKNICASFGIAT